MKGCDEMDINQMNPASGRILAEDGSVKNVVDILGAGIAPMSSEIYDIEQYSPRSGRVIGEDGLLYNLVDLLENGGGGTPEDAFAFVEDLHIEATGDEELTIYAGSMVAVVMGGVYVFEANEVLDVNNLDDGGAFVLGSDYYIYICDGKSGTILLSLDPVSPLGFDETDSRKIGGFHYGVNRRDTAAPANVYEGIVPRSIWTHTHRPKCAPEGMVYLSGGVWVDIYLSSDDGVGGVRSVFNALPISGVEALNWYVATNRLTAVGKRMLRYEEFVQAAAGSPPGTGSGNLNAWSSASERATTGFVTNAVSNIGCRDCVGNLWEWLSDIIASGIGENPAWFNPMPSLDQGQMWINADNDFRALLAGGSYFNGALIGARSACTQFSPWTSNPSFGVRGACVSL